MNELTGKDSISPEMVQRLIEVQEKDRLIKNQELELKKQADQNMFEYAKMSLEANKDDRTAERAHIKWVLKAICIAIILVILILIGFIGYILYLGKDNIASDIMKTIGWAASVLISYFLGYKSQKS